MLKEVKHYSIYQMLGWHKITKDCDIFFQKRELLTRHIHKIYVENDKDNVFTIELILELFH